MTGTYTDGCNYYPSPRSTDPQDLIREKNIAIGWLRSELERREAELADRERLVGELLRELAGVQ